MNKELGITFLIKEIYLPCKTVPHSYTLVLNNKLTDILLILFFS